MDPNEVDWPREIFAAGVPYAKEALNLGEGYYRNKFACRALSGMIKHFDKPKIQNAIGTFANLKMKGYNGLQKIFNVLGSEYHIKSINHSIGLLDAGLLAFDLTNVWISEDKNVDEKMYGRGKKIAGTIGGIIGGIIGSPLGFFGSLGGGIVGGYLGEKIYDGIAYGINKACEFFSGIMGKFRTGGVEFVYPKEINEFKNNFSFDKCHYIAFEYEDLKNNFNVKQMINLINSKFLINNIKVHNLNDIYDTILKEISYGFLYKQKLPSISLNFNKEGLLYSIMDEYYKNTITGNILTFLDYYLKSYVNGGFFKEDFIFNWQNNQNENRDYLQKNLTDFKKYLYDLTHNPNDINYCSMYDLVHDSKNDNNYVSAFRII